MKFTYETQENATYLVYSIAEDDVMDTVSLGMIMNNRVPGLAPVFFAQMDAQKFLRYNVSSKISVQQFFEGGVTRNKLVGVFTGIIDAMLAIEDYMIDSDTMILNLDYIYTDVSTYETHMICLPKQNGSGQTQDLASFFKNIVFGTKFDQSENCEYVARLLTYFNSASSFSLLEFKKLLDEIAGKAPAPVTPAPQAAPAMAPASIPAPTPTPVPTVAPMGQNMQSARPQPTQPNMMNGAMPIPQGNNGPLKGAAPIPMQAPQGQPPVPMQVPQAQAKEGKKPGMFAGLLSKGNKAEAPKEKKEKKDKKAKNVAQVGPQGISIPGQPAFDIPGVTPSIASKKQAAPQPQAPAPQQGMGRPAAPQQGNIPQQAPARPAAPQPANVPPQQGMARPAAPQQPNVPPMSAPQPVQSSHITQVQGGFGETTVLSAGGGAGETTVLSAVTAMPFLTRTKNNEKIPLNKPVFRIGKERSFVDYFISDNPAVSRSHANIISREGLYFVLDTNSTNHTYVNGQMIQSNLEIQINPGDKIRFANEEFEFRIF